MADLEEKFKKAADSVKNLKARPTDQELLETYALFKQATVGDNDQPKPGMFQLKEKAKHETWLSKKGMTKDAAKVAYVVCVEGLIKQYGLKE